VEIESDPRIEAYKERILEISWGRLLIPQETNNRVGEEIQGVRRVQTRRQVFMESTYRSEYKWLLRSTQTTKK
jgi:hypothetical protein